MQGPLPIRYFLTHFPVCLLHRFISWPVIILFCLCTLAISHPTAVHSLWEKVKVTQLCLTLCNPMIYTVHGILQARILEWVAFPRGSFQPRDPTQISHITGRFFIRWATGKPENARVGSLSLLQQIFLTQELNQGLLHCRQILYHLSHQGSPVHENRHLELQYLLNKC